MNNFTDLEKVTCQHEPCQNEGECRDDFEAQSYWCICRPGFTGGNCELIGKFTL